MVLLLLATTVAFSAANPVNPSTLLSDVFTAKGEVEIHTAGGTDIGGSCKSTSL